jgi:hypothetical protein
MASAAPKKRAYARTKRTEAQPRLAGRGLSIIPITAQNDIGVREQVLAASAVAHSRMPLHNELR